MVFLDQEWEDESKERFDLSFHGIIIATNLCAETLVMIIIIIIIIIINK